MQDEIKNKKELLKQRKNMGQMENKLLQPEEKEIRALYQEISCLKNRNEYKKIMPDGSEVHFEFVILEMGTGKNRVYNLKSTLFVDSKNIKPEEERDKLINEHKHLEVNVNESGSIETKFVCNYSKINYELLIYWVSYSYDVCCQFLNI